MKDETLGVAIEEFVGLKPKMYSFLVDNDEHKKAKDVNGNIAATISHNYIRLFCWIINVSEVQWIELKVKAIELELMIAKCYCHVLMTKYIPETMDMTD